MATDGGMLVGYGAEPYCWNGSTEVMAWRVFAGTTSTSLSPDATADWAEFETAMTTHSAGPYFQVAALDR